MRYCCTSGLGPRATISASGFASADRSLSRALLPQEPFNLPVPRGKWFGAAHYRYTTFLCLHAFIALMMDLRWKVGMPQETATEATLLPYKTPLKGNVSVSALEVQSLFLW